MRVDEQVYLYRKGSQSKQKNFLCDLLLSSLEQMTLQQQNPLMYFNEHVV